VVVKIELHSRFAIARSRGLNGSAGLVLSSVGQLRLPLLLPLTQRIRNRQAGFVFPLAAHSWLRLYDEGQKFDRQTWLEPRKLTASTLVLSFERPLCALAVGSQHRRWIGQHR